MSNNRLNSIRVLLSEIIDYAGLFPPSQVPMNTAVRNFSKYLRGRNSWMLGRFIVPVDRLDEFSAEVESVLTGKNVWRLSVLANSDLPKTLKAVSDLNHKYDGKVLIDTLEIKSDSAAEIKEAARILPKTLSAYFEIPPNEVLTDFMTALAVTRQRAKIRTGGITPDAFPSTDAIIKFMRVCIAANVPFKATAGLHHPLRCTRALTYEKNSPVGTMHGFLNLFLSAAYLRQDLNNSFVHRVINEFAIDDFRFGDDFISWQDHRLNTQLIEILRQRNAISFGSCSFLEPIEDLRAIGLL